MAETPMDRGIYCVIGVLAVVMMGLVVLVGIPMIPVTVYRAATTGLGAGPLIDWWFIMVGASLVLYAPLWIAQKIRGPEAWERGPGRAWAKLVLFPALYVTLGLTLVLVLTVALRELSLR